MVSAEDGQVREGAVVDVVVRDVGAFTGLRVDPSAYVCVSASRAATRLERRVLTSATSACDLSSVLVSERMSGNCCARDEEERKGDTHPVLVALEQAVHVVRMSPCLVVRTRNVQEVAPDLGKEAAVGDLERPGVPVCWLAGCDLVRLALRGGVTDT